MREVRRRASAAERSAMAAVVAPDVGAVAAEVAVDVDRFRSARDRTDVAVAGAGLGAGGRKR